MSLADPRAHSMPTRVQKFVAPPADCVRDYLLGTEELLFVDAPALNAFVVDELPTIALTVAVGIAAIGWGLSTGNLVIAGLAMVIAGILLLRLQIRRWSQRYTSYVLTDFRVIRLSGVFSREAAWIPWAKVTDVRIEESWLGRIFGYSTVHIDSANEHSGLADMKNLRRPRDFYLVLTQQVHKKQMGPPAVLED
ncbi:MAG: PH domain-containing protein [Ilumatobacteraceae bacterium]